MDANPGDPSTEAPSKPEPKKWEIAVGLLILALIVAVAVTGTYKGYQWLNAPEPPKTAGDIQNDMQSDVQKSIEKELRPNKWIRAKVGQRPDGPHFAFVEYKPILQKADSIEMEMMDAYKVIYTSELHFDRVEIHAWGDLYDSFGRESEAIIFNSQMGYEEASRVNWDKLYLVDPQRVMSHHWVHQAIR